MELKFKTVETHEECTHFLIDDDDAERLNAIGVVNGKLYNLFYDDKADEYYIINEEGSKCVDIDVLVHVKMVHQNME